jgi:hypothetical protein
MTPTAEELVTKFEKLSRTEQNQVASIILRRALETDYPALSDDELVLNAEEIFLDLDRCEGADARSKAE